MFYAVVHGHKPGIYTSWKEVQENLQNYPGACYKAFATQSAAEDFITTYYAPTSLARSISRETVHLKDSTAVYVESYHHHFALIILAQNGDRIKVYGPVPRGPMYKHRDFYAIYVALSIMSGSAHFYTRNEYVHAILSKKITNWHNTDSAPLIQAVRKLMTQRDVRCSYVVPSNRSIKQDEAAKLAQYAHTTNSKLQVLSNDQVIKLQD